MWHIRFSMVANVSLVGLGSNTYYTQFLIGPWTQSIEGQICNRYEFSRQKSLLFHWTKYFFHLSDTCWMLTVRSLPKCSPHCSADFGQGVMAGTAPPKWTQQDCQFLTFSCFYNRGGNSAITVSFPWCCWLETNPGSMFITVHSSFSEIKLPLISKSSIYYHSRPESLIHNTEGTTMFKKLAVASVVPPFLRCLRP